MQIIIHDLSARTGNSVIYAEWVVVMEYSVRSFSVQKRWEENGVS